MRDDELPDMLRSGAGASALSSLEREDLDPYSVEELSLRIDRLEGEIARVRVALDSKKNRRSAAEALFSFKG
ncbi:DUF1192 domain-containing protein [Asticcacaulis sp. EMRT-3]|uniref:DUF1192 domain-containing protein n=1 Tax=Asticcacaulis sp. EMRT-3 TaxID=3040349 RepID=UPI0024AFDD6D|nr:DUF1192 domain-containing protein [Asticcacaulis sp. EMRT-3]MDI7773833.1 DUF1192 domain-containing protein [Asticcacaulis sp. EMRT-3]